jgi:hypothetical protein
MLQISRPTEEVRLSKIVADEREREKRLIEMEFVEEDDSRLNHWEDRISGLRESKKRLSRIYLDFEEFELPYVYEDKEEVKYAYQSLIDSISLSRKNSVAVQIVQNAIDKSDIRKLHLLEDQKERLLEMFSRGSERRRDADPDAA